jgi:hypothetical protein
VKPSYKIDKVKSPFISAAVHLHQTNPSQMNQLKLINYFRSLIELTFEFMEPNDTHSLIIIELLKKFQSEPYFAVAREYLVEQCFDCPDASLRLALICMLSEAIACLEADESIPDPVRRLLFNCSSWYKYEENTDWNIIRTNESVILEIQKIFRSASLDSGLLNFAASLYFLQLNPDFEHECFSISILTQLAQ